MRDLTAENIFIICEYMKAQVLTVTVFFTGVMMANAQASSSHVRSSNGAQNTSGETRMHIEVQPGGRFNAINMTLWQILSVAYPVDGRFRDEIQLTGGPGWINHEIRHRCEGRGLPRLDTNKQARRSPIPIAAPLSGSRDASRIAGRAIQAADASRDARAANL